MTSVSKNVYTDKPDDIVDKYNNTKHRAINIKPIDVKDNTYINIDKKLMIKILKLGLVIGLKKFLRLK